MRHFKVKLGCCDFGAAVPQFIDLRNDLFLQVSTYSLQYAQVPNQRNDACVPQCLDAVIVT